MLVHLQKCEIPVTSQARYWAKLNQDEKMVSVIDGFLGRAELLEGFR
jgi:hypothetical protein